MAFFCLALKAPLFPTYEVAAVDESTRGESGLQRGEGLHRAVRGGAAGASRSPEEDLRLAWLLADKHTDT